MVRIIRVEIAFIHIVQSLILGAYFCDYCLHTLGIGNLYQFVALVSHLWVFLGLFHIDKLQFVIKDIVFFVAQLFITFPVVSHHGSQCSSQPGQVTGI